MKVLVTGANGLLASNTIRELNSRGIEVRGMVRETSNLLSLDGAVFEKVFGDITNYKDVLNAADGCDIIIHAAANTSQKSSDRKSNSDIAGVNNIIKVVEQKDISRLIFVSSANPFGHGTKENPGSEEKPVSKVFKKSLYAKNKLEAQQLVLHAAAEGKINAVVVNPTFIIGAYDAKPSSGRLMLMYLNGRLAFYPPGGKNFVNAQDAAIAICNSIRKGRSGESYLLAGENLSYKEFYEKVKLVTGVKKKTFPLSGGVLKTIGYFGNAINSLGFSLELTKENADILSVENYYSSLKAQQELDMPQTPNNEAIVEAFNWFHSNKYFN